MSEHTRLLVEIGTEELPPKALLTLARAFADELQRELETLKLAPAGVQYYATPRRLAVYVDKLQSTQADEQVQRRGPALSAAFDESGKATKAAEGFAASCGVSVDQLDRLETDKGSWLAFESTEQGKATETLLEAAIQKALDRLPIPKRMRWGQGSAEFVRPVHWVVVLLDQQFVDCEVMGVKSGDSTRGHRFHHPQALQIRSAGDYLEQLKSTARVVADFEERRRMIADALNAKAGALSATAILDPALLEEVTALVEWPVVINATFDEQFLSLPEEVLIASMQDHQKYFPLRQANGTLSSHFLTVANIESSDEDEIRRGNERVIHPRLSDAAFFWQRDTGQALADFAPGLAKIVYQDKLGSLQDKCQRVEKLAIGIAKQLGHKDNDIIRAAQLAKCDLLTDMVGEFPELQGVMGRYYAEQSGEAAAVADAIAEHYLPRYAGDELPASTAGQVLALADRLDTLCGIFAIGQAPTGDRDPFALRRAALGCLRILIECELEIDLQRCLESAAGLFDNKLKADEAILPLFDFMMERLRRYYTDGGFSNDQFESVVALTPASPLDFQRRMLAVQTFSQKEEAESLAAANKRIKNILKKNEQALPEQSDATILEEEAEKDLAATLDRMSAELDALMEKKDYMATLTLLASLRTPVDRFFDEVMVMCEDEKLKLNRLALLASIMHLFQRVADISHLQA